MRGYKFKLKATAEQESLFRQFAGACRVVYNLGLQQRENWFRQYRAAFGKSMGYVSQARELTALRAEFDWLAAISQTCQQQALRDLDSAYQNFFAGRGGYPKPRRKGVDDVFRFQGREVSVRRLNRKWSAVRLPKIGEVKFRDTRPMSGVLKNVTVCREANGWHIAFCREVPEVFGPFPALPSVGIDRGVANTLTLSTGEVLALPRRLKGLARQHRLAQRKMARKKRGSRRYIRQRLRAAKIKAHAARIRKDFLHKAALSVARRFGEVALEDLKIKNMTKSAKGTAAKHGKNVKAKAGLNRAILEQGWGLFKTLLAYKLEERGGTLHLVNPAHTSRTCAACGAVHAESRKSQAVFQCIACGHRDHADVNAAINILRRNPSRLRVEGDTIRKPRKRRTAPDETRSGCAA